MITTGTLKQWGSSLGVVVPKEIVNQEHLQEGEEVIIEIKKKKKVKEIFGKLKDWKINTQKVKDELRKDW